jgi:uncharacterized membrane protein
MSQSPNEPDQSQSVLSLEGCMDSNPTDETMSLVKDIESGLRGELPAQQQGKVIRVVREVVERHASFSGPQPPPELLAQYEQICPGWAARLLEMGEREQLHRLDCDKKLLELNRENLRQNDRWIGYSQDGQRLGFAAFIVIAFIGLYALHLGMQVTADVCFGSFALGIVGLFIKGTKATESDLGSKEEPTPENTTNQKQPATKQQPRARKSRKKK